MADTSLFHSLGWFVAQVALYACLSMLFIEIVIDKVKDSVSGI